MARDPDPVRFATVRAMTILAARGLGKVDRLGVRGATMVSIDEVVAMALVLAQHGLIGIVPGTSEADLPGTLYIQRQEIPHV